MACFSGLSFIVSSRKRSLALAFMCTATLLSQVLAAVPVLEDPQQTQQILRVGYTEFVPFTYQNSRGQPAGAFIDITRKVMAEAGYTPEFLFLPPSRMLLHLRTGALDLAPTLSGTPLVVYETLESWVSPDSMELHAWHLDTTQALTEFDQLRHKRLIVISGYNYGGLITWMDTQSDIHMTEAPDHRAGLEMLKRDRGDYLLDYHIPVQALLSLPEDAHILSTAISSREGVWVFSLTNPRAALLREEFDDAYIRLAEKGEVPPLRRLAPAYRIPGFPKL